MKPIPSFLSHLPVDKERGFVIPYFTEVINGKADFRYASKSKAVECYKKNLCWICGKKLDKREYWVIVGVQGLENRTGSDYPMHEKCARFSLEVCPYLHYGKLDRKTSAADATDDVHIREKPEFFYLVKSDKIKPFKYHGVMLHKFRPVYTERYGYENNHLIPIDA